MFYKAVGLLLTTVALTMGASFWFDALNRVVGIRSSAVKRTDEIDRNRKAVKDRGDPDRNPDLTT